MEDFVTKIKLGSVTNLSDARYAAALGAEWVGFNFDKNSAEYINPVTAKEIIDWIEGVDIVGEFGEITESDISDYIQLLNLTWIEVNNNLSPNQLNLLPVNKIKVINKGDDLDEVINDYGDIVEFFLLKGFNAKEAQEMTMQHSVIWDVPVLNDDVVKDIKHIRPTAINLKGEDEEQPGTRDFSLMNEFVDQLRTE